MSPNKNVRMKRSARESASAERERAERTGKKNKM